MKTSWIAAALFCGLTLPAVGAEALSAGKPLAVTPAVDKANQRWPAVAAGQDNYLVVWQEGDTVWGGEADIYAARVAADGTPLDPRPVAVCKVKGFQIYPTVAFDGENYLVVWSDFRNAQDWDVYSARVTPQGKVLDPDGFAVATVSGNQAYAVVASDGKGSSLLAWSDVRPQPDRPQAEVYELWGTLVRNGKPLEAAGHALGHVPSSILAPAVTWDGAGYIVIAGRGGDGFAGSEPFAVTVSAAGKAQPVPIRFGYSYSLAANPAAHSTLVWFNNRREHGAYSTLYGTGVYIEGKATGGSRVLGLQSYYAPQNEQWCAVAFDGHNFVAVVEQSPDCEEAGLFKSFPATVELAATRIDPSTGKPLDAGAWPFDQREDEKPRRQDLDNAKPAVRVVSEPTVQLRHPAIASLGAGKSLLVYSRHGGVEQFKIHSVLLDGSEKRP